MSLPFSLFPFHARPGLTRLGQGWRIVCPTQNFDNSICSPEQVIALPLSDLRPSSDGDLYLPDPAASSDLHTITLPNYANCLPRFCQQLVCRLVLIWSLRILWVMTALSRQQLMMTFVLQPCGIRIKSKKLTPLLRNTIM